MEALRAEQTALADDLATIQQQLDEVRASASSPDGLITATVDGRGRVTALDLDARIYRRTNTGELASQILAAIDQAGTEAAAQTTRVSRRVLGLPDDGRPEADPAFDLPRRILGGSGPTIRGGWR
ncbi:YbaB/EbfC family nucleoid-associated protein [Kribbella sp. NPDC058245]|uniref:YbaB/EbfC family nucleoid-associated protein n=1 Tax=Kribbella sp. NPDC058245 TaxID=3346399 RepID=UPI0036E49CDE